jgi:hypothetical protein
MDDGSRICLSIEIDGKEVRGKIELLFISTVVSFE